MAEKESTSYITHNPRSIDAPWFIPTCLNRYNASDILKSCATIENGNFLVRPSENQSAKYTITIWFNQSITHVRVNQLANGRYQLDFQKSPTYDMPTFGTVKDLIEFFSTHDMKLVGHSQGFVKLKFNPKILDYVNNQGGINTYGF